MAVAGCRIDERRLKRRQINNFLQGELHVARGARLRYQIMSVALTVGVIVLGQVG